MDSKEYKELKRLAKKNVEPKKCGKTFLQTCDTDENKFLSKSEWTACLRSDFTCKFKSLNIIINSNIV